MVKRLVFLLVAVCLSCKPAPTKPSKPSAGEPRIAATVITIRTTTEPEKKTFTRSIVVAGDKARDLGEPDVWRLYDTKAKTVTFVDDVAKTIRTEPYSALVEKRRKATAAPLPSGYPRVQFSRTKERRVLLGVNAEQSVIESGRYRRELWLAEHPAIPRELFAMMHLSEAPSSPLAAMTRAVDDAIAVMRGFPLADRISVPFGSGDLIVERTVTTIVRQDVPVAALTLPRDYEDLTAKPPAPAQKKK